MKHLEEQIKFIDKKLLPLYGFKNIIDYTFVLCISDLDNLELDLNKLNDLIDEFRKVFHSKNFSLHKTQYKILTKSQAICLLKTCLEITSIPFDICLKKNKKYLRLICKNNILEDYINTIKMAENRTFNNNLEIRAEPANPKMTVQPFNNKSEITVQPFSNKSEITVQPFNNNLEIRAEPANPKMTVQPFSNKSESKAEPAKQFNNNLEIRAEPQNPKMVVEPWIPEGLKKHEMIKKLTKEQLNNGIKKINNIEFFLEPKRLVRSKDFNDTFIEIDMKNHDLHDKTLKSFCVKFYSKKINNQPIISENFIDHLIKNIEFKIYIGPIDKWNWMGKFTNGTNCIIDNILMPNKFLVYHDVVLRLTNIDEILHLLKNLEIKVSCEYVNFYTEIDNVINKSMIEQSICIGNKYNILRMISGMAGNAYDQYLDLDKFNEVHHCIYKSNDVKNTITLNKNEIINESKLFIGNPISLGNVEGFEITNCSKDFVNKNASNALNYNYDFVCWNLFYELKTKGIEYYRTSNKNTFTHFYKINICSREQQLPHTISKLQIVSKFNSNKILNTCVNYYGINRKKLDTQIKYNLDDNMLELDLENKHLFTYGKITDILIQFESENEEELIDDKINVVMKAFLWNKKYIRLFTGLDMITFDPNSISQEYEKYFSLIK